MQAPEPSRATFFGLVIPNILANLTVPLAGLIDLALLGHLDDITPLAGVALAGLIFDLAYWSFSFLRMSTTALSAKALGSGDFDASADIFFRSLVMAAGCGLILLSAKTGIEQLGFYLLDGSPLVEQAGREYFNVRIWGAPATLGGYVTMGWLLGRHHAKDALLVSVVMNGVNITLDYIFIYKLDMGAGGAGLATMIAEVCAFLLGLVLVRRHWAGHPPFRMDFILRSQHSGLWGLQGNIMVRTFCLVGSFSLFTNFSAGFGTLVLAANTVLLRLLTTAAFFIDGYAFSLESLAGKYAGAGDMVALNRSLRMALRWNVGTVLVFIAVFMLYGDQVMGLITSHQAVIDQARVFLPYLCTALALSGFAYIYDGFFIGLARGAILRNAMLISTLIGFLPLAVVAVHWESIHLLWISLVVLMGFRAVTLGRHTIGGYHLD